MTTLPEPDSDKRGFSTRSIHAGQGPDPASRATITPITMTTVFTYSELDQPPTYDYGRHGTPTRTALDTCLASLENARYAVTFSSGMAAIDAAFRLLAPGDHMLIAQEVYGGTCKLAQEITARAGICVSYADTTNVGSITSSLRPNTRMLWIETPANPLLTITDIEACAKIAHGCGALLAVDSTFATPYLQNPLALGADIVMHSTTKYISGHSDVMGGVLVTNDSDLYQRINAISRIAGAVPSPMDCWLTLRGMKTLALRMERHQSNAAAIAHYLECSSAVERVYYPGLHSHPGHNIAAKQMRGYGGMVAANLQGGANAAVHVMNSVRTFVLTGSLGGVESIISYPARMSHAYLSAEQREKQGIGDGLIRLSVGIEDGEDLIADLHQAINRL